MRTILVLGPTAGGKTQLAIDLANQLPDGGECICADSMQVYRGMDIGTAKPTADEQAAAPHHLIDVADPGAGDFSVDRWLELAERCIDEIAGRGRVPIIVGGTNLYIQAFMEGLFDGPAPDQALRDELQQLDNHQLRAQLEAVDPQAADRIHFNDRKRAIRAIEVFRQTGRPISSMQGQWSEPATTRPGVFIVGMEYPAEAINRRINARVRQMIEQGLVAETRTLLAANQLGPQAREALGYRQIIDAIQGRISLDEAVEQIKIRTRRFAKQQRTWLRRFRRYENAVWIEADQASPQTIAQQALGTVSQWLPSREIRGRIARN